MKPISNRRVERVRHEVQRREVEVVRREPLGLSFVRIVLGGESLQGFTSLGFDDHVKVFFGDPDTDAPRRDFTPRYFSPVALELTIDFALHGAGPATDWARQATPGQRLVIGGPRSSMVIADDHDWHMLAGDETAAPAISRRLEELPPSSRARVLVALKDRAVLGGPWKANVEIIQRDSMRALLSRLEAGPLPEGEGFIWCAGEASAMARARDIVLRSKGVSPASARIAAYWKQGAAAHHQELGTLT